jgi:hypothetical protein
MNQVIYYGNIATHVSATPATRPLSEVTDFTLTFTGFDPSIIAPPPVNGPSQKLDLLFYNRVNEIGEVLSSLVYISNPLAVSNVSNKVYDVRKLYTNTDAERTMNITKSQEDYTYLNTKWKSGKFFSGSLSPLSDFRHNELAVNSIPSVKIEKYGFAFDGWYTQLSVGVRQLAVGTPPIAPLRKGLLGIHNFAALGSVLAVLLQNDPASPYLDALWSPYTTVLETGTTNPDDSILVSGVSLADVLTTLSVDNPYIKQEIFVLPTYISLYNNAVIQYAEYPTYGNLFPILRDKHRVIHSLAIENNFLEAQYVLQSTDFQRMTATL